MEEKVVVLVALVVLVVLLRLLVLLEARQVELPCSLEEGCDFSQLPAAQNLLQPSECCECALFWWQWLQWKSPLFLQWSCDSVLRQFLQAQPLPRRRFRRWETCYG